MRRCKAFEGKAIPCLPQESEPLTEPVLASELFTIELHGACLGYDVRALVLAVLA